MDKPNLYRRRFIPDECVHLKDDVILSIDSEHIVTSWHFLKPKPNLTHAYSCYYMKRGYKISRFYNNDNIICWYCDILTHEIDTDKNTIIFNDLLADVVYYPDGKLKVLDLDELADAYEKGLITAEMMTKSLRIVDDLLHEIYENGIDNLDKPIRDAINK